MAVSYTAPVCVQRGRVQRGAGAGAERRLETIEEQEEGVEGAESVRFVRTVDRDAESVWSGAGGAGQDRRWHVSKHYFAGK